MVINRKTFKELIFFGIAGFVGYLVDAGVTILLSSSLSPFVSRVPAFILAATATWIINRNITFSKDSRKYNNVFYEYLHYISLMTLGIVVNYIVYAIILIFLPQNPVSILFGIAVGSLAGMIVNYLNSKKYIFNSK